MYTPNHFIENDEAFIKNLVSQNPFATIVSISGDNLEATHLPFIMEDNKLIGHIARANPIANIDGQDCLVIFQGENAYISPNFYPTKHIHHKEVPTWNYSAIHFYGKIKIISDKAEILKIISELTNIHEQVFENPWKVSDAPNDFIEKLLNAIVGIEISIEKTVAKSKLSQNKSDENKQGIITGLEAMGIDPKNLVR